LEEKMNKSFQSKVALVTGAGSGLGKVSALAFAREGAKVIVSDVDEKHGQQTAQIISKAGGDATFVKVDVTQAAQVENLINETVKTYGGLHYAHNNVGILQVGPLTECTEEEWQRVIDVNLKSVWLCMKYEILYMVKHGGGAIVNTSSTAGLVGAPNTAIYVASKHGVNGLTKSAALEYAKAGIRINAVCPFGMKGTGIYERTNAIAPDFSAKISEGLPMGRVAEVEEVAEVVLWLCSSEASYVTGLTMAVDGGQTAA
jgi:NAD(P)-dependent dehydrogenase (short-subunit alcohol dehydrogenase family)